MLNLACTDNEDGAYPPGAIINLVGDKSAGKSLLALSGLAETAIDSDNKKTRLIYDDAETANNFNMKKLFGKILAKRIEEPDPSETIEDYTDRVHDLIDGDVPFIHVLDSFDMIGSEADISKYLQAKEARDKRREGKEVKSKGSYGTGRARGSAEFFRMKKKAIKTTDSLLMVISQVRENLDASGPWSPKHYRAGGKALDHNAFLVIWLAVIKQIVRQVNNRKRPVGQWVEAKVDKNKINGKYRTVRFPVYYDYGVDDIGSIVHFLVDEKWWKKNKAGLYVAEELKLEGDKEELIRAVEEEGKEKELRMAAGRAWRAIESDFKMDRKRRFG